MTGGAVRAAAALRAWCLAHPVAAILVLGLVVAALDVAWMASSRPLGTFNPDEAGYLANGLRYQRALGDGLLGGGRPSLGLVADRIAETSTGPLVPLASTPFVFLGSRSVLWLLVVQPLFHALAACSVAGIAGRLGTPHRALLAGTVVLGLPGAVLAARSYTYGGPAAAWLALAVWCLLASERGRRTPAMVGFGVAVGALLLTRTMAVAFLPALVAGAVVSGWRSPRAVRTGGLAAAAAVVVAAPWWIAARERIVDYLVAYGYSDLADPYGSAGPIGRVLQRAGTSLLDVRPLLLVPALVVVVLAGRELWRRRSDGSWAARSEAHRPLVVVVVVVVVGYLALLTSPNTGIWFELPLEVLVVAVVVSLAPLVAPRPRRFLATAAVVAVAANLVLIGRWPIGSGLLLDDGEQPTSVAAFAFGDLYTPPGTIRTPDPQLLADPEDRDRVGAAWWSAQAELTRVLAAHQDAEGRLHQTVTGSGPLLNVTALELAQELLALPATSSDTPDTHAADLTPWLTPAYGASPRLLVVIRAEADPFPLDEEWPRVLAAARDDGWVEVERVALPDGGDVLVLGRPGRDDG